MTDINPAARREARRRRILENSENRMKRLLGQTEVSESNVSPNVSDVSYSAKSSERNNTVIESNSEDLDIQQQSKPRSRLGDEPREVPVNRDSLHNETDSSRSRSRSQEKPADINTASESVETRPVSHTSQVSENELKQRNIAIKFKHLKLILSIIAGVLVRLLLSLKFGNVFVKSIFVPFITLEIGLLQYQKITKIDLSSLQSPSLWNSALMLSGMNQDILHSYNRLTLIFTCIAEDFTVYFFTFVSMHIFI